MAGERVTYYLLPVAAVMLNLGLLPPSILSRVNFMKQRIALVSDMDGTLLRDDLTISNRNMDAIRKFVRCGGDFTVASGRAYRGIAAYQELMQYITLPIVTCHGACIYDNGAQRYISMRTLPTEIGEDIAYLLQTYPSVGCTIFGNDAVTPITVRNNSLIYEVMEKREYIKTQIAPLAQMPTPWTKIFLASPDQKTISQCKTWLMEHRQNVDFFFTEGKFIDILAKGSSKGNAIQFIAKQTGISVSRFVGIGDSANDIPLLNSCGEAYTTANGISELKEIASVLEQDNNHDAVASCIETYLLPKLID